VYDRIAAFLADLGVPRGLSKIGYGNEHVEALVKGTIPQRRVLDLAPGIGDVHGADGHEHLARILEKSRKYRVQSAGEAIDSTLTTALSQPSAQSRTKQERQCGVLNVLIAIETDLLSASATDRGVVLEYGRGCNGET
jgi:hypothetical protein